MKERPILFSAPMVRALLDGSKTQTRRVVKLPARHFFAVKPDYPGQILVDGNDMSHGNEFPVDELRCPYGQPGDRLWVRETWQRFSDDGEILFKADPQSFAAMNDLKRDECLEAKWRPSIFMPRWASRITREITDVRVERLQDISAADAQAEGIVPAGDGGWHLADTRHYMGDPISSYASLWESINGTDSWDANPWVWVIEFRKVTA